MVQTGFDVKIIHPLHFLDVESERLINKSQNIKKKEEGCIGPTSFSQGGTYLVVICFSNFLFFPILLGLERQIDFS